MGRIKKQPVRVSGISPWDIIGIVALCFVTYSNAFSGGFVWDDLEQIPRNEVIRSFHNIPTAFTSPFWAFADRKETNFYRPFQTVLYMVGYQIGGAAPWPYHLINVSLHALASIFVYLICHELWLVRFVRLLAATLFAVHPIHTEAVTWIAGLPDTGCGAFFLISARSVYSKHLRITFADRKDRCRRSETS